MISAVVASYGSEPYLAGCIESLRAGTRPPDEVLVADAGSVDCSVAVARRAGARVLSTENRGVGHLYNVGARAARGDLLLLANADVAWEPRCVELLADALEADAHRFAADPAQLSWDGARVIHARTTLRRGRLAREVLPGFRLDENTPAVETGPSVLANGAAMLVRRDRFLELGGFDETFFLEFEEIDLCWRAWLRGWETVHVPAARVRHAVGAATPARLRTRRLRSAHHNRVRFALKCLPARAAGRLLAGQLVATARHPLLGVPALAQVARELPEIARARRALRPDRATYERLLRL